MEGNSTAGSFTPSQQFSVADLVVVVVYFALNVAVGIWVRAFSLVSAFFFEQSFFSRAGFSAWNILKASYYFPVVICTCYVFCVLCCIRSAVIQTLCPFHPLRKDAGSLKTGWN